MILFPRPGDAHTDTIVVGITFVCAILLLLITLMMTRGYFKNVAVKKAIPVMMTS